MFRNYFKVAVRNLWNNKLFSSINIGGLALGIASSILLLSYVAFQFSYDNFHSNKKDIYRVNLALYENNKQVFQSAENYSGVADALKKDFPEVQSAARLYNMGYKNNCVFTYAENHFRENKFLYADNSFLSMFSFPFIQGYSKTALAEPFSAVISESLSKKLFGNENPMGKQIQMDDDDRNAERCKVTGIFKDLPQNSHIQFNILISYSTLDYRRNNQGRYTTAWDHKDFYTYIQLRPNTDPKLLASKFPAFVVAHVPSEKSLHKESRLFLQPLTNIHMSSGLIDEPETTVNEKAVLFLIVIAFFILAIAWVNYINLTTAESLNRAKEIGIRKVLGSQRGQLIKQFLVESFAINSLSLTIAILLILLTQPLISNLFPFNFSFTGFLSDSYGLIFIGLIVTGAFLSGLYPAFVLSSFKPIAVLKGKLKTSRNGITIRKTLVVFQYSLSIFLIIGTLVVYRQMHYMLNQDLGMKTSQVIALDRPGRWDTARSAHNLYVQRFKEALQNDPSIEAVGMSDELPGKEIRYPSQYTMSNSGNQNLIPINTIGIDEGYLNVLGIKMLKGRNFSKEYKTDKTGLIITESAANLFGFKKTDDPIGKTVYSDNTPTTILGIVNDFHQLSLASKATPTAFQLYSDTREFEYYLVKIKSSHAALATQRIQKAWNESFKGNPFSFIFLDEYFNRQYQSDIQFGMLFAGFAIIAIMIACIGLFGLVAYTVRQRIREIGVRKVLGASMSDLVVLLSKDFIKLVLLSNLIAWPLGWLLMNNWLNDFAYRIQIGWLVFVIAGFTALLISIATISIQGIKAATANPIKSLRTE